MFHKLSNSFIAKFFIILIIISFVVVGWLSPFASKVGVVATVGDENIYFRNFYTQYKRAITLSGLDKMKKQDLRTLRYANYVLDSVATGVAIQQEVKALKIPVSDTFVANEVKNTKYFQTKGKFSAEKFENLLRANGFTKKTYITLLTGELNGKRYMDSFSLLYPKLPNIVKILARNREQTRSALKAVKKATSIVVKDITPFDIKNYYNANTKSFATPEKRDITAVVFDSKNYIKHVSDKKAKDYYEKNVKQYFVPEKRSFYQFYGDKKTLQKFSTALKSGTKFDTAVKKILSQKPADTFFNNMAKDAVEPTLRGVAFSTKKRTVSAIHKGAFGDFVVYVKNIQKESVEGFGDVKQAIKARMARDMMTKQVDGSEKSLNLDSTLEDIAKKTHGILKTEKDISSVGGKDSFTKDPIFIKEIFATDTGENTKVLQLSNKQYVLARVDAIKTSKIPPYESVKDTAKTRYIGYRQIQELEKQIQKFKNIQSEKDFRRTAEMLNFTVSTVKDILKKNNSSDTAHTLIFNTKFHSTKAMRVGNNGYVVFTTNITTPKEAKKSTVAEIKNMLTTMEKRDILEHVRQYVLKKYPVSVKNDVLEKVYSDF